jgi:hypothetical protein
MGAYGGPEALAITVGNIDHQITNHSINFLNNYPNPFNPTTTIEFSIKENETGTLSIYNIKGQCILKKEFSSGSHKYFWDASKHASGLYLYRLQTNSFSEMKKMIMLK